MSDTCYDCRCRRAWTQGIGDGLRWIFWFPGHHRTVDCAVGGKRKKHKHEIPDLSTVYKLRQVFGNGWKSLFKMALSALAVGRTSSDDLWVCRLDRLLHLWVQDLPSGTWINKMLILDWVRLSSSQPTRSSRTPRSPRSGSPKDGRRETLRRTTVIPSLGFKSKLRKPGRSSLTRRSRCRSDLSQFAGNRLVR